ncbi:hypothetical protein [Dactylosporangium sp. CA-233914]|uniref:hypothetical protein n=1 Tax=Dactylosporangium sp. CA-233914 TaxID=3239934 RepID=UPI003D8FDED9
MQPALPVTANPTGVLEIGEIVTVVSLNGKPLNCVVFGMVVALRPDESRLDCDVHVLHSTYPYLHVGQIVCVPYQDLGPVPAPAATVPPPGALVDLVGPAALVAAGPVTGEVHHVINDPAGPKCLVRVLSGGLGPLGVGALVCLPVGCVNDQHAPAPAGPYIDGRLAVSPLVKAAIDGNVRRGEPPLRPDQGTRGRVTWMIIVGNPVTGRDNGTHPVQIMVRVRPAVAPHLLPVISTAELQRRLALALRRRWAALGYLIYEFYAHNAGKRRELGGPVQPNSGPLGEPDDWALVNAVRTFCLNQAPMLAAPAPNALPATLAADNTAIEQALTAFLRQDRHSGHAVGYLIGFMRNEQAVQAAMWTELGQYVETLPEQAAIVDFTNCALSRLADGTFRNGRYLVVASRRSITQLL